MTAYIDNITIVGTPEEIQEFIELRKFKTYYGTTIDIPLEGNICESESNGTGNLNITDCTTSGNAYFANDNVEFNT